MNNNKITAVLIIAIVLVAGILFFVFKVKNFVPQERDKGRFMKENSKELELPLVNPRIVINKSQRTLELFSDGKIVRRYPVGLGFTPEGDKEIEGDGKTPEGEFYICVKNPQSKYYLSLGLSYPNIEDAKRGVSQGKINRAQHEKIVRAINNKKTPPWKTPLGGEIFIHGNGSTKDWTFGCIALEDLDIQELYEVVPLLTPVLVNP